MSRTINKHYGKARPCRRVIIKHGVPRICVKISMVSPDYDFRKGNGKSLFCQTICLLWCGNKVIRHAFS